MSLVRKSLIAALFFVLFPTAGPSQDSSPPLTLQDAVKLALTRNPEVLIAQAQLEELLGKITEVRSAAFPRFNLEGFALRLRDPSILNSSSFDNLPSEFRDALVPVASNLFEAAISVKQPIYTSGKVRNAIHLAEETKKEKQQSLAAARQNITFRVLRAFHDVLLAEENQQVVTETRQQRQKQLELARTRFGQGTATEIDVLRSEVNLANMEPEIIRAANRIRLARAALNNLIVVDLEAPTRIVGKLEYRPLAPAALIELLSSNLEARPEIQAAKQVVEECRILQLLARSQNKLSIDMDGRFGYSVRSLTNFFNSDYTKWNITANFRLPFYDGGERAGLVVQAGARLRAAEQNLAQIENSVRLEIKFANDDLEASAKAIAAARLNVTQAEKVLNMMQANYQYGAATTLDVVDSQTALTLARNAVINATYLYEMSKARLKLATGSPILDQEVRLP